MKRLAIEMVAVVIAATLSFFTGSICATENLTAKHKAELAAISQANTKAIADAERDVREEERAKYVAMSVLDQTKFKELQDEINSKDRIIADVRAGTVRVRNQFTCPAATAKGGTGAAGTSTGMGDAAGGGGLQAAHVEFLLREAGRADEAVKQLQACQAIINADRSGRSKP